MKRKIIEQTCFCIIIALVLFISKNSNTPLLERGAETVLNYMETEYTIEDLKRAAQKSRNLAADLPAKVSGTISVMTGKMTLGDPIDEKYENGYGLYYLARSYEGAGEKEKAIAMYQKFIENFPNTERAQHSKDAIARLQQ